MSASRALITPLTACLSPPRPGKGDVKMHVWDVFLKYFEIKVRLKKKVLCDGKVIFVTLTDTLECSDNK